MCQCALSMGVQQIPAGRVLTECEANSEGAFWPRICLQGSKPDLMQVRASQYAGECPTVSTRVLTRLPSGVETHLAKAICYKETSLTSCRWEPARIGNWCLESLSWAPIHLRMSRVQRSSFCVKWGAMCSFSHSTCICSALWASARACTYAQTAEPLLQAGTSVFPCCADKSFAILFSSFFSP